VIAAEDAVRAWINSTSGLAGEGRPLSNGAFTRAQRSPTSGQYAVVAQTAGSDGPVAEPIDVILATIAAVVYGGTQATASAAASAYRDAVMDLSGCPVACGDTGVKIMVADNVLGPAAVPTPADSGEAYAYQVSAQFLLGEF
jgi:hypothetical protein